MARRIAVIRALWFTECSVAAIGERLDISGKTVSLLAKRAGLPTRAKRPRPVAEPAEVELAVKLVLSRTATERLTARAGREGRNLETLIEEILEDAAK
jgi:hypothetical protein